MKLLLYSDPREPITKVLLKHKKALNISPLFLRDFLKKGTIFDAFTQEKTSIHWEMPGLGTMTNEKDLLLINRAFKCDKEWFSDFAKDDSKFAQEEFFAYLYFAINAFPNKTESPALWSLSGCGYSLPELWDIVEKHKIPVALPDHYLGDKLMLPPNWNPVDVVCSEEYNFYEWTPNFSSKAPRYIFAFLRPPGIPCLSFNLLDHTSLHPMDPSIPLDINKSMQNKIKDTSRQIHGVFGLFASEILFFIDGEKITFGMINNIPKMVSKVPDFEQIVLKTLRDRKKK